ncbi:MAG TPA: MMPL family transporter [Myxococcaceae bacterium]|nr:MMPL family transporter [Myxococcaceae bacterium]
MSRLALTLVLSGAVLAGVLASRITVEQDIGAMLPDGPGSPREAARLLEEFGVLNVLLLDLEIPGASPTELARAGNELATRIRSSGAFSEVLTGPTTEEILAVGRVLFPRRLYLLEDPTSALEGRLSPSKLQASLTGLKAKLAAPQAIVTKGDVLRDPLGLNDELLSSLSGAASVQSHGGQLLSPDQTHLLLVTVPRASALDTDASAALLARVESEGARLPAGPGGPARLLAVGGPRFAAESAGTVKHDVLVTMLTSIAALIAIFVVRFRSLRLLAVAFVTLAFGIVGGLLAVALVDGRIHALTFAFGSVLIGIAIDYPMYLLNAASVQAGTPLQRMAAGLEESRRSLWLGFLTTLMAFGLMLFSKFPGLRELALFAGAGIAVAFAATLVLVVPIGARWGLQHLSAIPSWMLALGSVRPPPTLAWGTVVAVIAVAAVSIPRLQFDGELRHLDAQRPATLAEYEEVRKRFGLQGTDSLVVARGATVEDALRLSDRVARSLSQAQQRGDVSHVVTLSSFLPSLQSQVARRARLADLDVTAARVTLTRVSGQLGFSEGAFDPFWSEVESVRSGEIPPVQPEDLAHTSLGALVRRLLRCFGSGCIVVTSFEPSRLSVVAELRRELPPETVVIDGGALAADTVAQIPKQLALLSGVGLLLNLLLLAFAYRSPSLALLACLPGALGLLGTLAILALLRIPLNLVSASALVLILGCGVDYGIFAVQGVTRATKSSGVELTGVLLTSATALAGFGTLSLASYRAIQSLGVAVGLGIGISAVVALFVVPNLWGRNKAREAATA